MDISKELDTLTCQLIGEAFDAMDDGKKIPVMLAVDCEDDTVTFEEDEPDGCVRAAIKYVAGLKEKCTRYALLYDGSVQEREDEGSLPAVLVEFGERGMESAWSAYILYRRAEDGTLEVADPQPAGKETLLLA